MPASPTIASRVTAIETSLGAISGPLPGGGAGIVHPRPRHTVDESEFATLFFDTDDVIRSTFIEVQAPREEEDEARHKFWIIWPINVVHIRHFQEVNVNSFAEFWDEVQKIKDTLRRDTTIFGIPERDTQRVAEAVSFELTFFGKTLVHQAIMSLEIETSEVIAP